MIDDISWNTHPLSPRTIIDLDSEWTDLANNAIEKNIYLLPWFVNASTLLWADKKSDIVTIYHRDLLIGLFVTQKDFGYAKLPVRFYRNATHRHQLSGTPLVRTDYAEQFVTGLLAWLDTSPASVSFLLLTQLSEENEITTNLRKLSNENHRLTMNVDQYDRAMIKHPQPGINDFEKHIPASRRKSLRRKQKALSKIGEISIQQLTEKRDLECWFENFAELENSGWKRENNSSLLKNPEDANFYRELLPHAFDANALNFFRLTVDGKPIAYTMDFICKPFSYCHRCAYDYSYKKYAPGVMMEYETLKFYTCDGVAATVDSCTAPENQVLNELWPDRKSVVTLAIAKNTVPTRIQFNIVKRMKQLLQQR